MHVWLVRSPEFGTRDMWSVQGPASSLNCPAVLVLEFQSIENKSDGFSLGGWLGHLPPASSFSCRN